MIDMKTAEEIIRQSSQTDFQNGSYKAIVSIDKIEKWMKTYAKQESEKTLSEFKDRLINAITLDVMFDDGYDSLIAVQNIIKNLK